MWLTRFGIRSVFPASRGTQKLWSVSAESKVRNVGVGMRGIADWNMQFVGSDNAKSRVTKFPPELMADGSHFDRPRGFGGILDGVDHARRGEEKHQHNEDRNHGPGELYLIAAINLRRLTAIVVSTPAELRNGIGEQAENNHKNDAGDGEHQQRQMKDRICGG